MSIPDRPYVTETDRKKVLALFSPCAHPQHRFARALTPAFILVSPTAASSPDLYFCKYPIFRPEFGKQFVQELIKVKQERTARARARGLESNPPMPSSCKDIREALAQCLQESDCIMVYRNQPSDCLRPPLIDTMPLKCQQLKKSLGECKRGMVDMRKRFRGNMPIAVSKKLEGGSGSSGQLYGGKPAYGSAVRKTDGTESAPQDWRELENEKSRKG